MQLITREDAIDGLQFYREQLRQAVTNLTGLAIFQRCTNTVANNLATIARLDLLEQHLQSMEPGSMLQISGCSDEPDIVLDDNTNTQET